MEFLHSALFWPRRNWLVLLTEDDGACRNAQLGSDYRTWNPRYRFREENSVILIHELLESELHIVPVRATLHGKIKQR